MLDNLHNFCVIEQPSNSISCVLSAFVGLQLDAHALPEKLCATIWHATDTCCCNGMQQFLELQRHAVVTGVCSTARNSSNRKPPAPSNSISIHAFNRQSDLTVESNDKITRLMYV